MFGFVPPFGWPGWNLTPPVTADSAGYTLCPDLALEDPAYHRFVRVGETIEREDEFWKGGSGPWVKMDFNAGTKKDIGLAATSLHYPIRRRNRPTRWSCGHGRDETSTQCQVCAVLYYRRVVD